MSDSDHGGAPADYSAKSVLTSSQDATSVTVSPVFDLENSKEITYFGEFDPKSGERNKVTHEFTNAMRAVLACDIKKLKEAIPVSDSKNDWCTPALMAVSRLVSSIKVGVDLAEKETVVDAKKEEFTFQLTLEKECSWNDPGFAWFKVGQKIALNPAGYEVKEDIINGVDAVIVRFKIERNSNVLTVKSSEDGSQGIKDFCENFILVCQDLNTHKLNKLSISPSCDSWHAVMKLLQTTYDKGPASDPAPAPAPDPAPNSNIAKAVSPLPRSVNVLAIQRPMCCQPPARIAINLGQPGSGSKVFSHDSALSAAKVSVNNDFSRTLGFFNPPSNFELADVANIYGFNNVDSDVNNSVKRFIHTRVGYLPPEYYTFVQTPKISRTEWRNKLRKHGDSYQETLAQALLSDDVEKIYAAWVNVVHWENLWIGSNTLNISNKITGEEETICNPNPEKLPQFSVKVLLEYGYKHVLDRVLEIISYKEPEKTKTYDENIGKLNQFRLDFEKQLLGNSCFTNFFSEQKLMLRQLLSEFLVERNNNLTGKKEFISKDDLEPINKMLVKNPWEAVEYLVANFNLSDFLYLAESDFLKFLIDMAEHGVVYDDVVDEFSTYTEGKNRAFGRKESMTKNSYGTIDIDCVVNINDQSFYTCLQVIEVIKDDGTFRYFRQDYISALQASIGLEDHTADVPSLEDDPLAALKFILSDDANTVGVPSDSDLDIIAGVFPSYQDFKAKTIVDPSYQQLTELALYIANPDLHFSDEFIKQYFVVIAICLGSGIKQFEKELKKCKSDLTQLRNYQDQEKFKLDKIILSTTGSLEFAIKCKAIIDEYSPDNPGQADAKKSDHEQANTDSNGKTVQSYKCFRDKLLVHLDVYVGTDLATIQADSELLARGGYGICKYLGINVPEQGNLALVGSDVQAVSQNEVKSFAVYLQALISRLLRTNDRLVPLDVLWDMRVDGDNVWLYCAKNKHWDLLAKLLDYAIDYVGPNINSFSSLLDCLTTGHSDVEAQHRIILSLSKRINNACMWSVAIPNYDFKLPEIWEKITAHSHDDLLGLAVLLDCWLNYIEKLKISCDNVAADAKNPATAVVEPSPASTADQQNSVCLEADYCKLFANIAIKFSSHAQQNVETASSDSVSVAVNMNTPGDIFGCLVPIPSKKIFNTEGGFVVAVQAVEMFFNSASALLAYPEPSLIDVNRILPVIKKLFASSGYKERCSSPNPGADCNYSGVKDKFGIDLKLLLARSHEIKEIDELIAKKLLEVSGVTSFAGTVDSVVSNAGTTTLIIKTDNIQISIGVPIVVNGWAASVTSFEDDVVTCSLQQETSNQFIKGSNVQLALGFNKPNLSTSLACTDEPSASDDGDCSASAAVADAPSDLLSLLRHNLTNGDQIGESTEKFAEFLSCVNQLCNSLQKLCDSNLAKRTPVKEPTTVAENNIEKLEIIDATDADSKKNICDLAVAGLCVTGGDSINIKLLKQLMSYMSQLDLLTADSSLMVAETIGDSMARASDLPDSAGSGSNTPSLGSANGIFAHSINGSNNGSNAVCVPSVDKKLLGPKRSISVLGLLPGDADQLNGDNSSLQLPNGN